MGEDEAPDATDAGHASGEFSGEAVVREVEVLEVGPGREVDNRGEAVVVEAKKPELREASEGPSGPGEVEAVENEVSDSAIVAGDTEPRPGTGVS